VRDIIIEVDEEDEVEQQERDVGVGVVDDGQEGLAVVVVAAAAADWEIDALAAEIVVGIAGVAGVAGSDVSGAVATVPASVVAASY